MKGWRPVALCFAKFEKEELNRKNSTTKIWDR
jgi:hypothetical protein